MIDFDIRRPMNEVNKIYTNVKVTVNGNVEMDLGMLDEEERKELSLKLIDAAYELLSCS